jgi:hypothetical protein
MSGVVCVYTRSLKYETTVLRDRCRIYTRGVKMQNIKITLTNN